MNRPAITAEEEQRIEEFFRDHGLPHLAADYDPREDTLNRLLPVMVLVMLAGMAIALRPDWPTWQRGLAVLAGLGIAGGGIVVINLLRRRPAFSRPARVGYLEAAVLILSPALAALVLGDGVVDALVIGVGSVVVAGVFYALTSLGVVPMLVHQWRPALSGLRATAGVALRALPPMVAVLLFLAMAGETWQAFGLLEGWRFGALLGLFGLLSAVILVLGSRRDRRRLHHPTIDPQLERDARTTAAEPLVQRGVVPATPELEPMAKINIAGALLLSLSLRVLAVGAVVGLVFLAVGVVVMDRHLTEQWIGQAPRVLLAVDLWGSEVIVSEPAVRVAAVLGGFAALYFSAVSLGEGSNRDDMLGDELRRMRCVMAAWAYYRGARTDGVDDGAPSEIPPPRGESSTPR